jgi:hypothetical protein
LAEDNAELTTPAIAVVNDDDDNNDGDSDNYDLPGPSATVDGNDDIADLAELMIRSVPISLPSGWTANLELVSGDVQTVRIFDGRSTSAVARIGPSLDATYQIPDIRTADLMYGIEGVDYPGSAPLTLALVIKRSDNSEFFRDEVRMNVADVQIVPDGYTDYLVPGSSLNVIRYSILAGNLALDSAFMKVYKRNLDLSYSLVRTLAGLPTSNGANGYAEVTWDARDGAGNPLTDGEYKTEIVAEMAGFSTSSGVVSIVQPWYITITFDDDPAFAGADVTGIDKQTITPSLLETKVQPTGGDVTTIPGYATSENAAEGSASAELKNSANGDYLFYTTPTKPDSTYIRYTLNMHSRPLGVLDKAGNEWDINEDTDAYENKLTWVFGISADGQLTGLSESFAWEDW